jgi:hypothetical protein
MFNLFVTGTAIDTKGFCGEGLGFLSTSICANSAGAQPLIQIGNVVSVIIGFITIVAGLFFLFQLVLGGIAWMSSTGDKTKLQGAQDRITQAMIGLIIVVSAYAITSIVGHVVGIDILLNTPEKLFGALTIQ